MDLEHLALFRDIVQTKSVSRGATLNGISQSAASQHLQELEHRFGVTLLDRSTRPFTLTPAGRLYYEFCRDVLRRYQEFEAELGNAKNADGGTVRVASIYSVGLSAMSQLQAEFSRQFPHSHLQVEYLRPDKVYEAVLADRADIGLVSYPEPTRQIAVRPWLEEEMVVAAAPSHPLARHARLKPADLRGQEYVAFDEDLPIRRHIDRFLREHELEVNTTMHFDNVQMIKEAVSLGSAISILPGRVMRTDIEQGRLVAIPLEGRLVRPIGIIHRKKRTFNNATRKFLELLNGMAGQSADLAALTR